MDFLANFATIIGPRDITKITGVSHRTAQRWIAGTHTVHKSHMRLLMLYDRGRAMPAKWPQNFRFTEGGHLDMGYSSCVAWQQLDWYFYSQKCWHQLLDMLPKIEARIDYLMRSSPAAVVIDLQRYKDEIAALKNRPFTMPANFREYYQLDIIETHRKSGC